MSISSKILQKKIQSLRPDLLTGLTPEILNELCDDPITQPFLKWFCDNVNHTNVLSKDELYLKNKLQDTGEWLSGKELDEALEEATRDNPELLKLIEIESEDMDEAFVELEALKDLCETEKNYMHSLKSNISNFKELSFSLEDDIEQETNNLEKEKIKMDKAYNDCSIAIKELDNLNHSFCKDMKNLLDVYTIENKVISILWTQMPIDLFIKQIKLYSDCIDMFIKQQFNMNCKAIEQESLSDNSKDRQIDRQVQELTACRSKLTNLKFEEINGRLCEMSYKAMIAHACSIYNNGNVKVPDQAHLTDEILDLKRKKGILEENITLLWEQLMPAIERYIETTTTKVLQRATCAKMKRRQMRFDKLKFLLSLIQEHGHAYSDLLCMLMSIQTRWLKEISEFVTDASYHFSMEYSQSSIRCEDMLQQQEVYETFQKSIVNRNTFNKLFVSMILGNDDSPDALDRALEKYDQLIARNKEKERDIFENYYDKQMERILLSEKKLSQRYEEETSNDITTITAPFYNELKQYENTLDKLKGIETNLAAMRSAMKEEMKNNTSFKRKKDILWQRFLADPDTLRTQYEEAKQIVDLSHFGKDF